MLALLLGAAGVAQAQERPPIPTSTPLLRSGQVRLGIAPAVRLWNTRFGLSGDEPLGLDFSARPLGSALIPGLADDESALAAISDDPTFVLHAGTPALRMNASEVRFPMGIALGILDRFTVSLSVPIVRRVVEADPSVDRTQANVGLAPGAGAASVQAFLTGYQGALTSVAGSVDQLCTTVGEADPACLDGRGFVTEASGFLTDLGAAYDGRLFPRSGSAAGQALVGRVDAIRTRMLALGDSAAVSAFSDAPPLATDAVGVQQLQSWLTDPALGIAVAPIQRFEGPWELGDVEFGAALRLLEGAASDTEGGARSGYAVGVAGLYRLGTGHPDLPENLIDLGGGDGQDDVEVSAFGYFDVGTRFRTRFEGRYVRQLEGTRARRLALPDEPIAPADRVATFVWDPGDYRELFVVQEVRLTPELALGLSFRTLSKDADSYSGGITAAGLGPEVLGRQTEMSAHHFGVGASLWPSQRSTREDQWPLAVSAQWETALSGGGGHTPRDSRFTATMRIFTRLWGGNGG